MKVANIGCGLDNYGNIRIDKTKNDNVTLVADFNNGIPLKDNSVDEIRLWNVLEHTPNFGFIVDECYRILKKCGKIDLKTDYAGYLGQYLFYGQEHNERLKRHYARNGNPAEDDAHYCIFVESHLHLILKKFNNRKVYYCYGLRGKIAELFLRSFPFKFGAVQIGMVAEK